MVRDFKSKRECVQNQLKAKSEVVGDFEEEETAASSGYILDCSVFNSLSTASERTTVACAPKIGYLVVMLALICHYNTSL